MGIEIKGADRAYWYAAELENLDYHLDVAKAALKGDVSYNRSPIMRFKEVCFKVDGIWQCTRVGSNVKFHYIKKRKHIKETKNLVHSQPSNSLLVLRRPTPKTHRRPTHP
jgi:hypothetical protein